MGNALAAPIMCLIQKTREQGAYSTILALLMDAEVESLEDNTRVVEKDIFPPPIRGGLMYFHGVE